MEEAHRTPGDTAPGDEAYTGVENLEVMAEAVNYNRYLVNLIVANRHAGDATVDFGAGAGTFAGPASESGLMVTCVEPDDHLREVLARKGLTAVADIKAVATESIDYLCTLNVLEHIEDDQGALNELARVLRPGGRLLVYVPAFQVLFTSMDRKVGHHRRYRLGGLTDKIRTAGFSVRDARYADSLGFGASLVYRAFDRGEGQVDRRGLRLYDRYCFPISLWVDRIFGRLFGKNAIVVAEKPVVPSGAVAGQGRI